MPEKKRIFSVLRKVLFFVLPIVLLFFIFRKIEFNRLFSVLEQANPFWISLGIILRPLQIFFGSARWQLMNNFYTKNHLPFSFFSLHYWSGLAIGYFTPGGLGWDAYRVMVVGKRIRSYVGPVLAVVSEKLVGFLSVSFMIIMIYPFIADEIVKNRNLFQLAYYIILCSFLLFLVISFFTNYSKLFYFYSKIRSYIQRFVVKLSSSLGIDTLADEAQRSRTTESFFSIFKAPFVLIKSFSFSWGILIVGAICSQLIFVGLGFNLSFLINLFAAPVFFILFLIPLSFGSIGVREGAFILVYGYFGVPMEIALLVSFLNLVGLLLNNGIGALFIIFGGVKSTMKKDHKNN